MRGPVAVDGVSRTQRGTLDLQERRAGWPPSPNQLESEREHFTVYGPLIPNSR